jgi:hypothetical protein
MASWTCRACGASLLRWTPNLQLTGTYTPFNYHLMDIADTDLAGSSPIVLPDLDPSTTSTPHLIAFGGKQGNLYLLARDHMPGSLVQRQPADGGPRDDRSLLPPTAQARIRRRRRPAQRVRPVLGNLRQLRPCEDAVDAGVLPGRRRNERPLRHGRFEGVRRLAGLGSSVRRASAGRPRAGRTARTSCGDRAFGGARPKSASGAFAVPSVARRKLR